MLKYCVKWICVTNGEARRVDGDYMSCAVVYGSIQHEPDIKDCTFEGPLTEEQN